MSKDINLADPGVWDDSALINSWNDALDEYKVIYVEDYCWITKLTFSQKYHSIHVQGKKLEDVLTDEELAQLKM
jgi:hypothetical protein